MRIDRLELRNFKKFTEAMFEFPRPIDNRPESFHVIIGENGSGKSSVLDALSIALGVWLIKTPDSSLVGSRRTIAAAEKRLIVVQSGDRKFLQPAPGDVSIRASGQIEGHDLHWEQRIPEGKSRASNAGARDAIEVVQLAYRRAGASQDVFLPVIAYYGAARTWLPHHNWSTEWGPPHSGWKSGSSPLRARTICKRPRATRSDDRSLALRRGMDSSASG